MNVTEVPGFQKGLFVFFWLISIGLNTLCSALLMIAVHKRKSWANILLLSIALTGIAAVLLGMPLSIVSLFINDLLIDEGALCQYQVIVFNWYILMSFFLVVFISIDQYLAVLYPFMYNTKILRHPKRSLKIIRILLFFVTSGTLSYSIIGSFLSTIAVMTPSNICYYDFLAVDTPSKIFFIVNTIAMGLMILVILTCTILLAIKMYRMFLKAEDPKDTFQVQKANFGHFLLVIIIVFMAAASLFLVVHILYVAGYSVSVYLHYLSLCLVLSNSLLFPLIFILIRASVRQILKEIWKKLLYCREDKETTGKRQDKAVQLKQLKKSY
uniref:G-protein coupled receptors family 1 profile domain-containing protein n=1 Tax=Amphimedon queenslandica TaxID=400682 RepID=A0A1X7UJH0_AMPQE